MVVHVVFILESAYVALPDFYDVQFVVLKFWLNFLESDEKCSKLTAFMKDSSNSKSKFTGKNMLTKSSSQDSKSKKSRVKETKGTVVQDQSISGLQRDVGQENHIRAHSSGPELQFTSTAGNKNSECTIIDFDDCMGNSNSSNDEEKHIKYIDEDMPSNENCSSPPRESVRHVSLNGNVIKPGYVRGNTVEELFPMNENSNHESQSCTPRVRPLGTNVDLESLKIGDTKRMECDENSFSYTSGQLRVHGNKHSSYEMSNTPPIRNFRNYETVPRLQSSATLFSGSLAATNYNPREQFASQYLTPTENARLGFLVESG
ncbi:unnamed protein product [Enterobius vermicularis]|uniref:Ovule protein n=1 Tax=Enterobius vermicularis TaxID=51028 RepID=A0A0N4V6X3_ENTVE|nr:unnamed protein product [Enterobius vermicularis]